MNLIEIKELAYIELEKWGLIEKGWNFTFNRAIGYAGFCNPKLKEIQLSKPISLVETDLFILDTIRHEIAHALVGCHNQHNHIWKRKALEVGCSTNAVTYKESKAIQDVRLTKTKYVMCYDGKIVQAYMRKPAAKTFANIGTFWATHRKAETEGKLYIEVYNPAVHTEFI